MHHRRCLLEGAGRFSPSTCSAVHASYESRHSAVATATSLPAILRPPGMDSHAAVPITRDFGGLDRWGMLSRPDPTGELPATLSPPRASRQQTGLGRGEERSSTPGCTCLPCSRPLQTASGTEAFVFSTPFPFLLSSLLPFSLAILLFFFRGWY